MAGISRQKNENIDNQIILKLIHFPIILKKIRSVFAIKVNPLNLKRFNQAKNISLELQSSQTKTKENLSSGS